MVTNKQDIVIAEIKKDVCYIKESLERLHGKISSSDKKYAFKWVERVMIGMVGLILISVLSAIISMVINS